MSPYQRIDGGKFYGRTAHGDLEPVPDTGREPDAWICRRLVDFPDQTAPAGGELDQCMRCSALVVFNPTRNVKAPKICMQCAKIQPLPIGG